MRSLRRPTLPPIFRPRISDLLPNLLTAFLPPTLPHPHTHTLARSYATNLGGVPLELMLQLVNMLGADPWFNIPFAASDDYIAQFAAAVYDGLRPDLRVYVEYGNELWHTGFPGGRYAQAMGLALNTTVEGNRWYGELTFVIAHRGR